MSEFSNSFVENMMSNDEKSGDEEPLSLVQSLRIRMDEMGDCRIMIISNIKQHKRVFKK
jgi:hypothetical protein